MHFQALPDTVSITFHRNIRPQFRQLPAEINLVEPVSFMHTGEATILLILAIQICSSYPMLGTLDGMLREEDGHRVELLADLHFRQHHRFTLRRKLVPGVDVLPQTL